MNGPNSFLLFPKSNELTNPNNTGKRSEFLGGNIYWSTATGAHPVAHDFLTKWGEKGYEGGYLKYPTTDEIPIAGGLNGRRQEYQGGSIYFEQTVGAHTIQGAIKDKWVALGAQTGALGYPTSDEIVTPDGKGRFNKFQHGSIYWSPTTGAHPVSGIILSEWAEAGYEGGKYGYPTSDPYKNASGNFQNFQNGTLDYGLASQPVAKQLADCRLEASFPLPTLNTNWVESTTKMDCNTRKNDIVLRYRVFWTGEGTGAEKKKVDYVVPFHADDNGYNWSANLFSICFNGDYRFNVDVQVRDVITGAVSTTTVRTDVNPISICQQRNQECYNGPPNPADCKAALEAVLYARWFNGAARPNMKGGSPYTDRPGVLPTPKERWLEYDMYAKASPDDDRDTYRVVLDIGDDEFSTVYVTTDHYTSFYKVPIDPGSAS